MNEGMISSQPSDSPLPSGDVKAPGAFRTISEVAEGLALPQHVLRFWESKFQQIKPLKRGGGRRYYRPEDVKIISDIKELLYNQGFTIRGVQKLLRENGASSLSRSVSIPPVPANLQHMTPLAAPIKASAQTPGLPADKRREIEGLLAELKSIRKVLEQNGF
jgi:DNA-binding transcriptional MerR regulator